MKYLFLLAASVLTAAHSFGQTQSSNVNMTKYDFETAGNVAATAIGTADQAAQVASFGVQLSIDALTQNMANALEGVGEGASTTLFMGSGTLAGIVTAMKDQDRINSLQHVQKRIDWFQDHIIHNSIADNTIKGLNIANKTKNMIGMMGATIGSFRDMTNQFNLDTKSKTAYSQQIVTEMNNFMNWKNELAGFNGNPSPYTPIFNFYNAYESETAQMRNSNGNLDMTQAFLSASSDQQLMTHMGTYNNFILHMNQVKPIINDMEVREALQLATLLERKARWLTLQINMEIYGQAMSDLFKSMKSLGSSSSWMSPSQTTNQGTADQSLNVQGSLDDKVNALLSGSTASTAKSGGVASHSNNEIITQTEQVQHWLNQASQLRQWAMTRMNNLMAQQMNPVNYDVYQIKRLMLVTQQQSNYRYSQYYSSNPIGGNYNAPVNNQVSGQPVLNVSQSIWANGSH